MFLLSLKLSATHILLPQQPYLNVIERKYKRQVLLPDPIILALWSLPQVRRENLCTQICHLACDWVVSAALANHRPADKFLCIIFPYSLQGPKCLNFTHTKSRLCDVHCKLEILIISLIAVTCCGSSAPSRCWWRTPAAAWWGWAWRRRWRPGTWTGWSCRYTRTLPGTPAAGREASCVCATVLFFFFFDKDWWINNRIDIRAWNEG